MDNFLRQETESAQGAGEPEEGGDEEQQRDENTSFCLNPAPTTNRLSLGWVQRAF